jgi:hypothetical protein
VADLEHVERGREAECEGEPGNADQLLAERQRREERREREVEQQARQYARAVAP